MKEATGDNIIAQLTIIGYDNFITMNGQTLMLIKIDVPNCKDSDFITMVSSAMASNPVLAKLLLQSVQEYNNYIQKNN